ERTEREVLGVVRAAGSEVREVVLTRNRRIMASLVGGGSTLRLHHSFASAPDAVLHAVARLFAARSTRERTAARRVVRGFLAALPRKAPAAPRKRRIPRADREHLERLRAEFERTNREHFGGTLPEVPIFLSGRMRSRNGHFSSHPLEIVISRKLCRDAHPGEAEHTLRHEMIHLWQHAVGKKPDHGAEFRAWARRLGVHPRAMRTVCWKE
ncbi:MAG TPA: SprT-like domain-containing protein, partial [Longimicrobiaceae bacterium]|nr:SprT-like domain-containing protein [Longimicrobiaceae bacterium]